jgi:hypothetical protein
MLPDYSFYTLLCFYTTSFKFKYTKQTAPNYTIYQIVKEI